MALTPKQAKFCQKYIETGNASEAYRQAYDAGNMTNSDIANEAYRLMKNPDISPIIIEMQEEHRERHKVTVDSLTRELEEARLLGISTEQVASAVSATMGKAKLHGIGSDNIKLSGEVELNAKVTIYMPDNGRDENTAD